MIWRRTSSDGRSLARPPSPAPAWLASRTNRPSLQTRHFATFTFARLSFTKKTNRLPNTILCVTSQLQIVGEISHYQVGIAFYPCSVRLPELTKKPRIWPSKSLISVSYPSKTPPPQILLPLRQVKVPTLRGKRKWLNGPRLLHRTHHHVSRRVFASSPPMRITQLL